MSNTNQSEGSKFTATRELDIAAIAKLVRADIKAAKIAGLVCSVTIERYSGGQSLNVRVKAAQVQIWTDAYVAADRHSYFEGDRYTDEAKALLEQLEALLQAYNYNRSDLQSDYHCVRFYGHAEFSSQLTIADRERTIARNVATSAARVVEAEATVAACEARLAALVAEKRERARSIERARIARDATIAEMCATAGMFLGNA